MANIKITMRDGIVKEFKDEARPGGSYHKSVRYEGAFVIVTDEWYAQTAFPQELIAKVEVEGEKYGRW